MLAFAAGEHDVLVCTTIIESGLDIPNANTIVIDRADTLGLAQLYQLRGRVGRSARRAYAYLLYRRRGPAQRHRAQAPGGHLQRLGAGGRLPDRALRPGDPRRRQHPRRRAARPHGGRRLRPLHAHAGRGCRGGEGGHGGTPGAHGPHAGQDRPARGRLPARRLRARGAPEAGALPAPRSRGHRRRARGDARASCSTATARCRRRSSGSWRSRSCATGPRRPG